MGKVNDSQNLPPALQALTSSMDDCITHLREQEAKLKEENEALKDRINKLEVDIGDWEMSDANKDDEMEQMRESIIEDLKEKDNKIKELEKTIEDHNDMVEAYDAVDCERLGAEEKIRELNEEIDEYDNQRLGAEEKIQEQHCEIDKLKKDIKGIELTQLLTLKKFKDKEEENEKLKKTIKGLYEDNEINVKTIKDHKDTIHTWKMSCKLKDNEIEELEKTIKKASKIMDGNKEQLDVDGLRKLLKEAEGDFDYGEDDDWDWAYGSSWEINDDGYPEWTIVMAGGGDHWWNYVLRPNGLYKCDKNGYHKLKGQLISCPDGNHVYHKDFMDPTDNGSREGESYMDEMIDWEDAPNPSTC